MKRVVAVAAVIVVLACIVPAIPCHAQGRDQKLRDDVEALKKGQQELAKELAEIKGLLRGAQVEVAPDIRTLVVDVSRQPSRGSAAAPLTLIEFTDFGCNFCALHDRETLPLLEREFVKTGKLRYVTFDLPLENLHPLSFKAAEAAYCAGEQGKYLEMREQLFSGQTPLEPWTALVQAVGLDARAFEMCMGSGRGEEVIRAGMATAQSAGIRSTPFFVFAQGDPRAPGKARGLSVISGSKPFDVFKARIEQEFAGLAEVKKTP